MRICIACIHALLAALLFVSCSGDGGPAGPGEGPEDSDWTFLFYGAADFETHISFHPFEGVDPPVASGENLDILMLMDFPGETAKLWWIDETGADSLLEDLGEVKMGEGDVLSYFLDYAKQNYPSKKYAIAFFGHGGCWGGACPDYEPGFSVLRMGEIHDVFLAAGGVDMVLFTAPCYMGATESAYELRDCTEMYIGSENASFYESWRYVLPWMFETVSAEPDVDLAELSSGIVTRLWDDWSTRWAGTPSLDLFTMCAVRSDGLEALGSAIDTLAGYYLSDPSRFEQLMTSMRLDITNFYEDQTVVDLGRVLDNLAIAEDDPAALALIQGTLQALSGAVAAEAHCPFYDGVHGLSIFIPWYENTWLLNYYTDDYSVYPVSDDPFGLDFVTDTRWDELISAAFEESVQETGPSRRYLSGRTAAVISGAPSCASL